MELVRLEELRMSRPSEIHDLLVELVEGVRKKRLDPQQAYALGWLVQLVMRNLAEVERERSGYEQASYGRVFATTLREQLAEMEREAEGGAEEEGEAGEAEEAKEENEN